MKRPNILLFFTDDQRFDTLHALNNPAIQTPNLDRLLARGTTFTRAHIPGGTSGAVCMPSRAMLHTGRTLFHIEGEGQSISESHTMLGEHLQEAGYSCYGIGKWHNGRESFARSFNGGAEIFFGGMADHWNVPAYDYDPAGGYEQHTPFVRDPFKNNTVEWRECDHVTLGKHSSELFSDAAINFLADAPADEPFLLYMALLAPHDPRTMPQEFLDLYDPADIELPPNFATEHAFDFGIRDIRDEVLEAYPRTEDAIKRHIAEYYAMISHLDHEFGRVVAALEANGHADDTIIVFAGDNGLSVGQHGLMGKQNLYEHSVRVPLIFAGPGIPQGERRDSFCYLLDIYPTLCDLLGLDAPPSVDGVSLLPCLLQADHAAREVLYLAYTDQIRGVRRGDYKYIEYETGQTQLFALAEDPFEMNNLIDAPEMARQVADLRQDMANLHASWDDDRWQLFE